jgi:hypothetical protein
LGSRWGIRAKYNLKRSPTRMSFGPLLFSIYAQVMMEEALEGTVDGVKVCGKIIPDVRFADDQGMVASSQLGLQRLMDRLNETAKKFDMKINVKKTKTMVVTRAGGGKIETIIEGQRVEQVKKFKYLGSVISEDGRCIEDVKQRIGMAKDAFIKRKDLLTKSMNKKIKKGMVKMLVWPVAMYGCETWTM